MAPNNSAFTREAAVQDAVCPSTATRDLQAPTERGRHPQSWQLVWSTITVFTYIHIAAVYGIYLCFSRAYLATILWMVLVEWAGGMGITAGAHRLWSHRAYKAKWQLRIILAIFQTIAFQKSILEWARDHRVHHKFSETNADPHNATRGFFFAHVGWLFLRKHPDVIAKGRQIDMSDLYDDPVVIWQRRTYFLTLPLLCFVLPVWVPCHWWGEQVWVAWHLGVLRYVVSLHSTWLVNSAAHTWGARPFDKSINPGDSVPVAVLTYGEGWHNYHHVFPWDYKSAELGNYRFNATTAFIDFFARLGWAYDLKTVSQDMASRRAKRTGDGSYRRHGEPPREVDGPGEKIQEDVWGWGDQDMDKDDVRDAIVS